MQLCAVTKTFPAEVASLAASVGCTVLGENYAQELVDKAAVCGQIEAEWHFLGAIQRNKVAKLAPVVSCFQGLARRQEAEAIAAHAPGARVLVQVDTTGRAERNGVPLDELEPFLAQLAEVAVTVEGLMVVAPPEPEAAETCFAAVRRACDAAALPVCSMGMTEDLDRAVAAGSTMVRVGRALFGART